MSDEPHTEAEAEPQRPTSDPQAAVNLRSDPPKVMRLSRKAIGIATAVATAFVGGALIYALRPESQIRQRNFTTPTAWPLPSRRST